MVEKGVERQGFSEITHDAYNDERVDRKEQTGWKDDVVSLARLGSSLILYQLSTAIQTGMIVAFSGHIGTAEQAGIGLAVSFQDVTAVGVSHGLASASDTLLSNAYGSPFKKTVGIFLQRSLIFFILTSLVVSVLNLNSDIIFMSMGQDSTSACIARRYLTLVAPGMLLYYFSRVMLVYLRIQDAYWSIVLASISSVLSTGIASYVLVIVFRQGVDGLAIATNIGYVITFSIITSYAFFSKMYEKTWSGWSTKAFDGWWQYAKLGGAGILLVSSEYICLAILTLLAGTLGPVALSAQAIGFQVILFAGSFGFALSIACSVRTGFFLGANEPTRAKYTVLLSACMSTVLFLIFATFVIIFRYEVAGLFTFDQETRETTANVLIFCMLYNFGDSIYQNLNGSLRGSGRQFTASIVNMAWLNGIAVPVLLAFTFTKSLTLPLTWLSLAGTEVMISLTFLMILLRTDWTNQAKLAYERVQSGRTKKIEETEKTPIMMNNESEDRSPKRRAVTQNILLKIGIILVVAMCTVSMCVWALIYRPVLPVGIGSQNSTNFNTCLSLSSRA